MNILQAEKAKLLLIEEKEEIKQKLDSIVALHKQEVIDVINQNSVAFEKAISEKDGIISKLQNQIADLRNELSQMLLKFNQMKENNNNLSSEHSSNVEALNQQLSKQIEIIETQQKDFEFRNSSIKERYDYERTELK